MKLFDIKDFQPLFELISTSRIEIRKLLNKHFNEAIHDEKRKSLEMRFFVKNFKFITKKWNIEILYELEVHDGLTFNEISRHLEIISPRTLSDCLKELQKIGLINRNVQDTRPPSVLYKLNDKGKGFVELSILMIFYLSQNHDND